MSDIKHPMLASDGWPFLIAGLLVFILALNALWWWLAIICLFYLVGIIVLFRDPFREVPSLPLAVVSPVDGIVTEIQKVEQGLLRRAATRITIKIYKRGAYTTRSPTEGKILSLADDEAGSRMIETNGLWIRTDENDDIVMLMQGTGYADFYPAVASVRLGERIGQGERVGLNRFARTCVLYLPDNALLDIAVGQKVLSGSTVLAEYDHGQNEEE